MSDVGHGTEKARRADAGVDALYKTMRSRYGKTLAGGNGYRSHGFFRGEQAIVFDALVDAIGQAETASLPILDIACGSGLMLADLPEDTPNKIRHLNTIGVDFNATACTDAFSNGLKIVRGDAFKLPLADNSIGHAVNCQFLNQQDHTARHPFLSEAARCLAPGGRLILLWRRANSLLHQSAHTVLSLQDGVMGRPKFPQYEHSFKQLISIAESVGLSIIDQKVTLPLSLIGMSPRKVAPSSILASCIGASNLLILSKQQAE